MARSKGPFRHSFLRRGMVIRILRRRQYRRIFPLLYPLSPATRLGRCLGRPRPTRLTAPCPISGSKTVASCCCPGVKTSVISLPLPSARTCTLVLNPPWLRPRASSFAGSPFLPQQRAGGLSPRCHRHSVLPNRSGLRYQPVAALPPGYDPRSQPSPIGRSGRTPFATGRTAREGRAMGRLFVGSTECHSRSAGGPWPDVQFSVSAVGAGDESAPTARC